MFLGVRGAMPNAAGVALTRAGTRRRRGGLVRRAFGWLLILAGAALVLAGAGVVFSGPHPGEEWYLRDVTGWTGIGLGLLVLALGILAASPGRREPGWWS